MKTSKTLVFSVLVLVLALAGCSTVGDLSGGMITKMLPGDDTGSETDSSEYEERNDRGSAEDSDDADSPYGSMKDGSLTMLPPAAAFQIVYAQTTFFTAGYAPTSDYRPGEGVRWLLTWREEDGAEDSIETEHALLSRGSDGEWWYISLSNEDYRIEYEFLIDQSDTVVRLRYRDSDMTATREADVSVPFSTGMYAVMEEDAAEAGYDVTVDTVDVTVPAGSWIAERITMMGTDTTSGQRVDVTWWRVEAVPGDTVRFEFVPVTDENEWYIGELQEIGSDYEPTL
jgi:hypothetical protein